MTTVSNRNELAKMLKQQRHMAELTLRELAARSGVSASHLGRIERGERFPSGHILRKIAGPLDLDESQLLTAAGYLSPESSSETGEPGLYRGLDPYVAKVLSEEPVEIQRTVVVFLTILKSAIAESLLRKQG
jgi:transcriptional regulator with XRE-family HTH domain